MLKGPSDRAGELPLAGDTTVHPFEELLVGLPFQVGCLG